MGTLALGLVALGSVGPSAEQSGNPPSSAEVVLLPTNHPPVPADVSQLWMAPAKARPLSVALNQFRTAVKLEVDGNFAKALPVLSQALLRDGPLSNYVTYYKGFAELRLGRAEDARRTFQSLAARSPVGFLVEAAALREAEADEALGDSRAALAIYEPLSNAKNTAPDDVLMRMGKAALAAGDAEKALTAFSLVYFEFPFSDLASAAGVELDRLPNRAPIAAGTNRYKLEVGRAEQLFGSKRYAQAQTAFESLQGAAQGDDRELVNLRLAECDYFLKRPRAARDRLMPYIERAARQGEALFFYAVALRDLGERDEYLGLVRRLADDFPTQTWSEEALNNLATYYIVQNDDATADQTFREMLEKFPSGRYAERAAWKVGWVGYRNRQYADTIRAFEGAAARFPRSDYRPLWLYWSARAHEALNETALAEARYTLTATDYLNSYYGRLALMHLDGHAPERRPVADVQPVALAGADDRNGGTVAPLPPNQHVIQALLELGLYDQAVDELHYAQKVWGDSSAIEATLAWIYQQQGQSETGSLKFTLYRNAINTMKRAYPQFLAAGGETLPPDLLRIIFPIGYWDLIRKYAAPYSLDPYLVAALVSQESTFVADIRSPAKAVGLMQLEASTARQYARRLQMKYSPRLLTNPEANIRMGTAYLADKIREFGDLHLVLASYNAGEGRVHRWAADRPGLPRDEFVDDIPFPETQNYVKKVLGTAEDYRRLYGPEASAAANIPDHATLSAAARAPAPAARRPAVSASKKKVAPAPRKPRGAA